MSQINRVPRGLQDLLQAKNFGVNPSELMREVRPTLEMRDFFGSERRYVFNASPTAVVANGSWDSVVVPDGELWFAHLAAVGVFSSGGAPPYYANLSLFADNLFTADSPPTLTAIAQLGTIDVPSTGSTSAAGLTALSYNFPTPMPFFGGETLQWYFDNGDFSGGNTYTCRPTLVYTKLEV